MCVCVTCAWVGNNKMNHCSHKSLTQNLDFRNHMCSFLRGFTLPLLHHEGCFPFRTGTGAILQLSAVRVASWLYSRQPSLLTPAPHPRVFQLTFVSTDLLQTWNQKGNRDSYKLSFLFFNISTNLNKNQIQRFFLEVSSKIQ